jgi:hypothetical protein
LEHMRGVRIARERRALRSPNITDRGLHRHTDVRAASIFEQGQAAAFQIDLIRNS